MDQEWTWTGSGSGPELDKKLNDYDLVCVYFFLGFCFPCELKPNSSLAFSNLNKLPMEWICDYLLVRRAAQPAANRLIIGVGTNTNYCSFCPFS